MVKKLDLSVNMISAIANAISAMYPERQTGKSGIVVQPPLGGAIPVEYAEDVKSKPVKQLTLQFKTMKERELFIADAIYHDDMTYTEVGKLVGVGVSRISQIYARFVRRCKTSRRLRAEGGYLPRVLSGGYDMLDEAWIPIDKALAEYNISEKYIQHEKGWDIGHWWRDCRYTFADDLKRTTYHSSAHGVGMLRLTVGNNGIEYWECNKHFFEKSLERPKLQKGRNGIFTAIPKQPAGKEK